jgi:signal transduction histidine kinase
VATTGNARALHPEIEVTLLRTAQEALANVGKHAGPSRVALTLSYMEEVVTLDVRDDGRGFVPDTAPSNGHGGFGLEVCGSGCATYPGRWRSNRSPAAPRSRLACRRSASRRRMSGARHG